MEIIWEYSIDFSAPIIFLNSNCPADRMRFTIAHELGHLFLHRFPCERMEEQANRFAAELLMPEREIRAHLSRRVNLPVLASLKQVWRVSMRALLKRACDLGIVVDERQKKRLYIQMSPYCREEPDPIDPDIPHGLSDAIGCFVDEFQYSLREVAEAASVPIEYAQRIWPTRSKPTLALVGP